MQIELMDNEFLKLVMNSDSVLDLESNIPFDFVDILVKDFDLFLEILPLELVSFRNLLHL